ncbi:hypothetical protein [Natrinema hispanicum]|uniref:DUF7344 domain-containing protein n=1 Tax=Natrinema hispanicum TaxID=392421 RepID=A0A1I0JQD9_9EURY|nr:hypothetical protein [Natrinema hispanicum]SDD92854.1 hypothetical protein SAMN05192552_10725 [Natrinema hispanicum]SEU11911.1 hypothetical protein SAMN04488694_15115 [Natrinema hispanicum]
MAEPSTEITDAFTILADTRRRYALYHLTRQDAPVSFDNLVTQVAAKETDTEPDAVDNESFNAVASAMHHVHLPMLSERGVVTYEANPGEIKLVDDPSSLQPHLDAARRSELGSDTPTGQR